MRRYLLCVMLLLFCLPITVNAEECNHVWGEWEIWQEPTCGEDGYSSRHCTECWEYEEKTIKATGQHKWDEWVIDEEPSCYDKGSKKRYCDICNEEEYQDIPAYGSHLWTKWYHEYESDIADCENTGTLHRECSRCKVSQDKTEPVNKNNHILGDWYVGEYPTVFEVGYEYRTCSCGEKLIKKEIPKLKPVIKLNKTKLTLKKGKTYKLRIKKIANGDGYKSAKSSKKKCVSIQSTDYNTYVTIKAKKNGTSKITIKLDSGVKATCTVKVK